MEELLLGLDLRREELDVVDEEDVVAAEAPLETVDRVAAEGGDELVRERLDRRVADAQPAAARPDVVADRMQQMRLADAGWAIDEERVVGLAGKLGHREGRRVREAVRVADDELLEAVLRVEAGRRRLFVGRRGGRCVALRATCS